MDISGLRKRGWHELEPHLAEQGYELVELDFGQQGGRQVLRIFIDKEEGIALDDCQAVSQLLSPILDESDLMGSGYMLEVSSPGIDRPVRKPEDFKRFAGQRITIRTQAPIDGRRHFKGVLVGFCDDLVTVECDGAHYEIHAENVLRANLDR